MYKKTTLSLALSRALAREGEPIGDPFGGPAYGERNMPLVAVAGAMYAAGTIATVGIAAMTTFQVIAAVGAITAGIGAVTGNEKLMKIGGVMSLAGGVGAFAQNQGWIGGAADAAGAGAEAASATEAATSAMTQNAQAADVVNAAGGNVVDMAQGGADVGSAIDAVSATPSAEAIATGSQGAPSGLMSQASPAPAPNASALMSAAPEAPQAASLADAIQTPGDFARYDRANFPVDSSVSGAPSGWLDNFKSIGEFMNKNKELTSLAGNAIGGFFDEEKEAKANAYNAQADLVRQQQANLSNLPVATSTGAKPGSVFRVAPATYTPVGIMSKKG